MENMTMPKGGYSPVYCEIAVVACINRVQLLLAFDEPFSSTHTRKNLPWLFDRNPFQADLLLQEMISLPSRTCIRTKTFQDFEFA
jgi:hypothetical protein